MMKIPPDPEASVRRLAAANLELQEPSRLATKLIDHVEDVADQGPRPHHRVQYAWDKELGRNIAKTVDNRSGQVVRKAVTDAEKDHALRLQKLKGLHVDTDA